MPLATLRSDVERDRLRVLLFVHTLTLPPSNARPCRLLPLNDCAAVLNRPEADMSEPSLMSAATSDAPTFHDAMRDNVALAVSVIVVCSPTNVTPPLFHVWVAL